MLNNITLQQIQIFLIVAEQLSLSEAAKDMFLNQSAVSRWIQRLEESLGTKLFYRNNRGVELTETGEFLYQGLKPIYEKLDSTFKSIRDLYDSEGDIIRIGCLNSSEVIDAFKEIVVLFEEKHKDIILKIEVLDFPELREQVFCGNIDVAVCYSIGFGEYQSISSKLYKKLETYLAVSANRPSSQNSEIPIEELQNDTLYLLSLAEMHDPEIRALKTCENLGFTPKDIKYVSNNFALEMAVKNNKGFAFSGTNILERFESDIKLYHVDDPGTDQYVMIGWQNNNNSEILKKFLSCIPE